HLNLHSFPTRRSSDLETPLLVRVVPVSGERAQCSSDDSPASSGQRGRTDEAEPAANEGVLPSRGGPCRVTRHTRSFTAWPANSRSEEHTSELQSQSNL